VRTTSGRPRTEHRGGGGIGTDLTDFVITNLHLIGEFEASPTDDVHLFLPGAFVSARMRSVVSPRSEDIAAVPDSENDDSRRSSSMR
jgi:hypothetical protein